jgi:hypothetical protein
MDWMHILAVVVLVILGIVIYRNKRGGQDE